MIRDGGARDERRQSAVMALILLLQATAAIFFVGDAVADLLEDPGAPHSVFESLVALALILGVLMGIWQLRQALARMRAQEQALDTARGSLAEVIEAQFDRWGLTPAERDVGLLALKGLDVAQIAEIRGAAPGTVRAQLTRIYAKAGVSGRAQFASWFVEDLLQPAAPSA
ncbi:helix-turn-helix transcriptional regulator [Pseudooceanicola sp. 200-1SW]|uniref:helix-turn-helix transcriptional regulator n=1 Tax=Pseudooceanicola sp. 200-1SW TaxID=3425949 RepID=UPI003D7FA189